MNNRTYRFFLFWCLMTGFGSCAPIYQGKNVKINYQGYQTIDDNYYMESFSNSNDIKIIDNQIHFGQDTVIQVRDMGCFFKKCSWQDDYFVYSLNWSFWKRKFYIFNKELRNMEMKFFLTRIEPLD